jgi:hypothetical protein
VRRVTCSSSSSSTYTTAVCHSLPIAAKATSSYGMLLNHLLCADHRQTIVSTAS